MGFIFFCCFILFALGLFGIKKSTEFKSKSAKEDFWQKEYEANNTPKKSIEHLDYITIDPEMLPFLQINDTDLEEYQNTIRKLMEEKIVNLNGITNTNLKLTYGTSNYPLLSRYDQNFTTLIKTLYSWGQHLHELGMDKEAKQVLAYGITCGTDISGHYELLARLYQESGEKSQIEFLIIKAQTLNTPLKNRIIERVTDIWKE